VRSFISFHFLHFLCICSLRGKGRLPLQTPVHTSLLHSCTTELHSEARLPDLLGQRMRQSQASMLAASCRHNGRQHA
jgi:hypothetical protein